MAIIAADGFKFSKTNTPTREGERIATIAEITNREKVPNPSVGMQIFVEDEQAHYIVLELGPAEIGGIEVPNLVVKRYKKVESEIEKHSVTEEKLSLPLSDKINNTKVVADKAAADIGIDNITLLQGGIDSDGSENVSSYYLRTSRFSIFKLEVNDGYTIGQISQYDLAGNFVNLYNDYTQMLEGVEWTPTSVVATDKEYMWVAVVFKGNSPTAVISPREAVVKTFVSGLFYFMQGGESDPQSAAAQAKMVIDRTIEQLPNEEDLTVSDEGKMQFANRSAEIMNDKVSSLGYVVLRKNKSFTEQITEPNCIYEIRYEFDLNGSTVTIKDGCTLKFNGGKLTNFKNLTLSNTIIEAQREHIFEVGEVINKGVIDATEPSENCNGEFDSSITGSIKNNKIYPEWFGAKADDVNDDSDAIQYALNTAYNVGGEVEFNGSAIKRYKVDYTIYLPPNSKMTAKNRPPKIYTELSGSNNKAEIYFTCRYLFRTKKNKNTDAESTRLTNEICVVMDSLKICGRYSRPKVTIDGTAASGYEDEITVYGDPYWVRKTYVFYGTKLKRSIITNVTAIYIGTFIYGNILNLSQISNNYISFHRAFSLGKKSDVNHSSTILNSGVSGLTDDLYELGYDTTITYPNGKSYTGYYEEIPTLKGIGGIIDSRITHNYLSGNGMYRPICFYETQLAMSGINNNYIDFCFSVFYNYTTVNSSCNTICDNIIDYCLMFYLHSCKDILVAENQIHKMSHEAVINTYIRGHFDGDTTNFSLFDKEVLNYKASFFVCNLCRRVDVINNTFYDTDALNNYKGGPYWASVHIKDNSYYNTPNDVICTKGLDEAYNGMNPCSDIYFDCFEKVLVDDNYISPSAQPIRPYDELEHNNRLRMNTVYPSDIVDCEYNAKYQYINGELTVFNGKLNNSNTHIAMIRPKSRGVVFNPDTKVWGFADRPTTDSAYAYMPNGIRARKGVGATRPSPGDLNSDDIGFVFFDTSIGKPVWWNGTAWVDSTGTEV